MQILAFDTATPSVCVAVGSEGHVTGEVRLLGGRRHAEQLVPAIRYLGAECGIGLHQLAAIGVGTGPGLFTGLRVGITTAKMLAQALRIPVVGVPTLDLLAYPFRHGSRLVAAVIDARRGEVFSALYRPVPGGIQRDSEYAVGSPEAVAAELAARGEDALLVGDGVGAHAASFASIERAETAGPAASRPSPGALVELAVARVEQEAFCAPWELEPLYLRLSDAEIAWERAGR